MRPEDLSPSMLKCMSDDDKVALKLKAPSSSKYGAIKVKIDGMTFDSKKEAKRYGTLKIHPDVSYFLTQIPFRLPGKVTYRVDFQIFWKDGRVTYEDVKGYDTQLSLAKRKITEDLYPVKIEIL